MARVSIFFRLTPKNQELNDALLKNLVSAADIASKDEPKTFKYSIAVPREGNTADPRSIYVIEEYADESGFELHAQQPDVQSILQKMRDGALADEPLALVLGIDDDFGFTRPEVAQLPDPFIAVTELFYKPGTGAEALRNLKAVSAASKQESGTLSLALYTDPNDADKLRIVGVYESQDYWINVHGKSKEVQEFQATTSDISAGVKVHLLKPIAGFLYKAKA
ncbi:hypothetical protein K432DRAFT_396472 [Lepidopterella palustris CBS 459.81]|uniref:ABM domain-containing protein n=1 Tax=Lepidopterella palustris CBS 459.81 TaxID=1314670 RepID=A0A8E2E352_9PEZI|nr:hypothetical protein K432DRAFT_396472 [Lepidopterella palustris CBS 459.81]